MEFKNRDDEQAVLFCNPEDAKRFAEENPKTIPVMAVSPVIPAGEITIIPQAEFLAWLELKPKMKIKPEIKSENKSENENRSPK